VPAGVGKRAAVVGGGPAGLSAAYFLAKAGWEVTVFEKEPAPGGVVRSAIPDFRISGRAVERDISLCRALGVKFAPCREILSLRELQGYDATVLAVGAHRQVRLPLEYGEAIDALAFLTACKAGEKLRRGGSVAVVGGEQHGHGRGPGSETLPGRREGISRLPADRRWMPAEEEELEAALRRAWNFASFSRPWAPGTVFCSAGGWRG
jgi:putative selenate reductase